MEDTLSTAWAQYRGYLPNAGVAFVIGTALICAGFVFYNIFLHPLRSFPGPLICRSTVLWRLARLWTGDLPQTITKLHKKYGPVIRISPNELSFIESQAWKDIYGHHGTYEMAKDPKFYRMMGKHAPDTIVGADREDHSRLRRQLAHGFSERSMRGQEPIIGGYVDMLIQRLEEHSDNGRRALDMRSWFNFITFDIIGNLGFGSDFGCLEKSSYHPWIDAIIRNLQDLSLMRIIRELTSPHLVFVLYKIGMMKGRKKHMSYASDMVRKRMELEIERPDFIEGLLKSKEVTDKEVFTNAPVLIFAGSETTATLLCGAVYSLGSNPEVLAKLNHEVRSAFQSEDEITLMTVNRLSYMLACIDESLRHYPPVAVGLPRLVPKGGHTIAGKWVPENASVSVTQLAANMSEMNFTKPNEFHPERFLGDEEFAKDDLAAMQPFSVGPRNCIGKNLTYAETRLILARILFKFDIELAPSAKGWIENQKCKTLWHKPELPIYLKPRKADLGE
ncbi:hypothetical protein M426DRAFT_321523 [Hypoxylon sp. CI-4A]|nr:hypothetical protein M426DRAFT_321523 [Hypoxylon sp. CI-4A]